MRKCLPLTTLAPDLIDAMLSEQVRDDLFISEVEFTMTATTEQCWLRDVRRPVIDVDFSELEIAIMSRLGWDPSGRSFPSLSHSMQTWESAKALVRQRAAVVAFGNAFRVVQQVGSVWCAARNDRRCRSSVLNFDQLFGGGNETADPVLVLHPGR